MTSFLSKRVVASLGDNDVCFGRGTPATLSVGNIRFREIIRSLLPLYAATTRRLEKDRLARSVVQIVRSRNGRFLRRIESPSEADQLNLSTITGVWILVEEKLIIPKVKQTFRDCGTNKLEAKTGHTTGDILNQSTPECVHGLIPHCHNKTTNPFSLFPAPESSHGRRTPPLSVALGGIDFDTTLRWLVNTNTRTQQPQNQPYMLENTLVSNKQPKYCLPPSEPQRNAGLDLLARVASQSLKINRDEIGSPSAMERSSKLPASHKNQKVKGRNYRQGW